MRNYGNCLCVCAAQLSANFIIGLANVSPVVTAPTLWNYAVCGQWPGAVGSGATVYLQCTCNTCITSLFICICTSNTRTDILLDPEYHSELLGIGHAFASLPFLQCACKVPASRFVIVHFPTNYNYSNFCELEVFLRGKPVSTYTTSVRMA